MDYFLVESDAQWNLIPTPEMERNFALGREKKWGNFEAWDGPQPIRVQLYTPFTGSGKPKRPEQLKNAYRWGGLYNPCRIYLLVSAELKSVMDQFTLCPHWWYETQMGFKGQQHSFYCFVPIFNQGGLPFIDLSATQFWLRERHGDRKVVDTLQFSSFAEYHLQQREAATTKQTLVPADGRLAINQAYDLFWAYGNFCWSERLVEAIKSADLGLVISPLSKYYPRTCHLLNIIVNADWEPLRSVSKEELVVVAPIPFSFDISAAQPIPDTYQQRIQQEIAPANQQEVLEMATYAYNFPKGLSRQQMLDSVMVLVNYDLNKARSCFPYYDGRDIVMVAQRIAKL